MEQYHTDTGDKAPLSSLSAPLLSIQHRILPKPFRFKGIRRRVGWSGAEEEGRGQRSVSVPAEPGRALRPRDGSP